MRRVGAHKVITQGQELTLAVVEICGDRVVNYYSFTDELPMTEWLGGVIALKRDAEGIMHAWQNNIMITEDI